MYELQISGLKIYNTFQGRYPREPIMLVPEKLFLWLMEEPRESTEISDLRVPLLTCTPPLLPGLDYEAIKLFIFLEPT